jgi:hypothetical protein
MRSRVAWYFADVLENIPYPSSGYKTQSEAVRSLKTSVKIRLHGVKSQTAVFFIVTALRTSNPKYIGNFRGQIKPSSLCFCLLHFYFDLCGLMLHVSVHVGLSEWLWYVEEFTLKLET